MDIPTMCLQILFLRNAGQVQVDFLHSSALLGKHTHQILK